MGQGARSMPRRVVFRHVYPFAVYPGNEHGGGRDGNFDGGGERDGRPSQRRRSCGAPLRPAKGDFVSIERLLNGV